MTRGSRSSKFAQEVRNRAVRMVADHRDDHASEWPAISSIDGKFDCKPERLRLWGRQTQRDQYKRPGTAPRIRTGPSPRSSVDALIAP